jgi:hypothetical protein
MVDETKKDQKADDKKTEKQNKLSDTDLDDVAGGHPPMPYPPASRERRGSD